LGRDGFVFLDFFRQLSLQGFLLDFGKGTAHLPDLFCRRIAAEWNSVFDISHRMEFGVWY
jgi:hypothetical protein